MCERKGLPLHPDDPLCKYPARHRRLYESGLRRVVAGAAGQRLLAALRRAPAFTAEPPTDCFLE